MKNVELVLRTGPRQKEIILSMTGNSRKSPREQDGKRNEEQE